MDRRTLLKSTLSTTLSAGLLAANAAEAIAAQPASSRATSDIGDFIETAPGVKLAFTDWGAGQPVVFVHAWALPSAMWDYQISALCEKGLRCIAYDRRGHGRSSKPGSGYDADTLADDLASVLNRLDLHGVTLVSHSLGSAEVVRYLTRARHWADRKARADRTGGAALRDADAG
jgi:non-heme chloroperoxidase